MKTIDRIPVSKLSRASQIVSTGAKVGLNYLKYYGEKITASEDEAKARLDKNNAEDIYDSLKTLKGSALKVAQMLSMEKSILPQAFVEKFSLSQFSVPPLSGPLVNKTFKQYFGQYPLDMFDTFTSEAQNAASIGQVHIATKNGRKLAIKIQYPGVAESISSDLALVKPIAMKMFNIKGKDSDKYFQEVEHKLLEETNYTLELSQSQQMVEACAHIPHITFPRYYPEWSTPRIITMDFMEGQHLSEFTKTNTDEAKATQIGQALWDFYMFQIHGLRRVHADPHPGNFLVSPEGELIALDFGCIKAIPQSFYAPYFELIRHEVMDDRAVFTEKLRALEIIRADDSDQEIRLVTDMFHELLHVFTLPFQHAQFDFSDASFFEKIAEMGQRYADDTALRKMNANRGSKHFIYINRTFFGLYNLMFDLRAKHIVINRWQDAISA